MISALLSGQLGLDQLCDLLELMQSKLIRIMFSFSLEALAGLVPLVWHLAAELSGKAAKTS